MSSSKRKEEDKSQPPTPPRWKGADSLELVYQLNERVFTLLKESVGPHRERWAGLTGQAIERAAHFPFLVVDLHFADETWWRNVVVNPQASAGAESASAWAPLVAKKLMNEVLVFAFHTARWDAQVARLVVGMAPAVAEIVRRLTQQQLDAISDLGSGALRLRWQEDEAFWVRLVQAARDGEREALADIHLHAKLLLSGALLSLPGSSKVERKGPAD